jgi:hypothetical protein
VEAPPVVCEPSDVCVTSECAPETGLCVETPLTPDEDQDGFRAPLPGREHTDPDACGSDCDDATPLARPGGAEICDGTDNDCDGIVDNGSVLLPRPEQVPKPVRVAGAGFDRSNPSSLAYGSGYFALHYWGHIPDGDKRPMWRALAPDGFEVLPESRVTQVNAPSFGASVAWSGSAFGTAWSDTRVAGNYEVYFSLFDSKGDKRIADLRLTQADGMSLEPVTLYDQGRFAVLWADRRDVTSRIYLQMLSSTGRAIGGNVPLTPELGVPAESPAIAATPRVYGVAYAQGDSNRVALEFRIFEKQYFSEAAPALELVPPSTSFPKAPSVAALGDRFLVAWQTEELSNQHFPGPVIWGAVVSDTGQLLLGPKPVAGLSDSAREARLVSYGNRALLGWTDLAGGKADIYAEVLDEALNVVEAPVRLTASPREAKNPNFARGDGGMIGLLYNDRAEGPEHAYFMSFGCDQEPTLE